MNFGELYILIKNKKSGKYFRYPKHSQDKIPTGFSKVYKDKKKDVYDKKKRLKPKYWCLQRIFPKKTNIIIINPKYFKLLHILKEFL